MKLKVTWQDGPWNRDGKQPVAAALLDQDSTAEHIGEDTLIFRTPGGGQIALVVPEQRLISALLVDEEEVYPPSPNGPPVDPDDLTLWNATLDLREGHREVQAAEQAAVAVVAWGDKKGLA